MERDDRGVLLLAAEPAAGLRLDDLRLLVRQVECPLQRLVDVVRALERAVDRHAAVVARDGDHRVVLDVELLLVADAIGPLEDDVGLVEPGVEVAARDLVVGEHVVALERVEDRRREAPSATVIASRGLAQRRPIGRGDQRQRLGVVPDLAADRHEDGLVVADEA